MWYYPGAYFCFDRGYIEGDGSSFAADGAITRGELAQMIHALDDSPTYDFDDPETDPDFYFTDLERGEPYTEAANWCGRRGILAGCGDGVFNVSGTVTREQLAVAMRAFARFKGYDTSARADLSSYPDASAVAAWARESLEWCVARGLIAGVKDHGRVTLSPRALTTRAQIATILKAFCEKVIEPGIAATALGGTYFLDGGGGGKGFNNDYIVYEEMLNLALERTQTPGFLYIGLATENSQGNSQLSDYFGGEGCTCDVLYESDLGDPDVVRAKVEAADIVYVGGGSTVRLVGLLKEHGIDVLLRKAAADGAIMAGTSAGAICFCSTGESWLDFYHARVDGIGFVDVFFCPHSMDSARYNDAMGELAKTQYTKCVAFDGASLEIHNGQYRALRTNSGEYMARLCEYRDGALVVTEMSEDWRPLSELFGWDVQGAIN